MATSTTITTGGWNKITLTFDIATASWVDNGDGTISWTPVVRVKKSDTIIGQTVYWDDTDSGISDYYLSVGQTGKYEVYARFVNSAKIGTSWTNFAKLKTITVSRSDTKTVKAKLNLTFKGVMYGSQTATSDISVERSSSVTKSVWTHTFNPGDCDIDGDTSYTASSAFNSPGLSKADTENKAKYNLTWLKRDNKSVFDVFASTEGEHKETYSNFKWQASGATYVTAGGSISGSNLKADRTWTANYTTTPSDTDATVGSIANDVEEDGYTFGGWYTDTSYSSSVKTTMTVTSDRTFYPKMTPNRYYVKFNLGENIYYFDDNGVKQTNTTPGQLEKIYDTNLFLGKNNIPTYNQAKRNGYVQNGWKYEDDDTIFKEYLTKDFSLGAKTANSGTPITLNAVWEESYDYLDFKYYIKRGEVYSIVTDTQKFTVNDYSGTEAKTEPSQHYVTETDNSYTFLGWCVEKPSKWDEYHGVFNNISEIDKTVYMPYSYSFDKDKKWEEGKRIELYGIWTATGKYVMLEDGWHKINLAYIYDGTKWQPIGNFYVDTANGAAWKHEVDNKWGV